jgi:methyl-accepting chemotaxis protein
MLGENPMFAAIAVSLRNLSVKIRIATAFALLVLMIAALGGFAIYAAGRIHQSTTDIETSWLPSVRELGNLRYSVVRHRAVAGRHVLMDQDAEKADVDRRIVKTLQGLDAAKRAYLPLISSPEEQQLFDVADAAVAKYLAASEIYLQQSRAHDKAAAMENYGQVVAPLGLEAESALEKVIELNDRGAAEASAQADGMYVGARGLVIAVVAAALLFAAFAGWYLIRNVAKPVIDMTRAMARLADHDMTAAIPAVGQKDEIGRMAGAVQVFKDNMIKADALAAEQEAAQAAREQRTQLIETLTQQFDAEVNAVVEGLTSASTELQSSAQSMTQTAEETSRQSNAVAAASEQTSANVQTVATATEQLTGSITEIGEQVQRSASVAQSAVDQASEAGRTMGELRDAAQKIGEVVKLINDIASQTNLLALNATIEAARAGDAGKGFAVVASEVKILASQTARATEEISAQVGAIQDETERAVEVIGAIASTIGSISEAATTMASAVEEQAAATQEIARNVQQAASGTQEVTSNITGVSQAAGETGSAAAQVLAASGGLAQQSTALKGSVVSFLSRVKAA